MLACDCGDGPLLAHDGTCAPAHGACAITDGFCQRMVLAATACERGDDGATLPPVRQITQAQFRSELEQETAKLRSMSDTWAAPLAALRLAPSAESTLDAMIDTAVGSVAAYYDPKPKRISIIRDAVPPDNTDGVYALSHELTHYLQDRDWNLRKLVALAQGSTDEHTALAALVEGEAVATSTRVLTRFLHASPERFDWTAFFDRLGQSVLDDIAKSSAPLYASAQDLPYWIGGRAVEETWDCCGHEAVDAMFKSPPEHLDDGYGHPSVAPTASIECGPPEAPAGFTLAALDRLGLAGAIALLTAADAQDSELASKVLNDAIAVYVPDDPSGPQGVVAWRLHFQSSSVASEFASAIRPLSLTVHGTATGSELLITSSTVPSENPLSGSLLDACPALVDLHATGDIGPAALLRVVLHL